MKNENILKVGLAQIAPVWLKKKKIAVLYLFRTKIKANFRVLNKILVMEYKKAD